MPSGKVVSFPTIRRKSGIRRMSRRLDRSVDAPSRGIHSQPTICGERSAPKDSAVVLYSV